ncbi:MAG TPA: HNH endonuclease signature motif containing protein [Thermomicrobiaceae bacterium]|nr:HNH endonuclease signature motif containing protein [Thermomicrobiaceae bacterium]
MHDQRNDNWVFGDTRSRLLLLKISWFSIQRHVLVTGAASPDDPALAEYWAARRRLRTTTLSPSMQKMAHRQGYVCATCGEPLVNGEELHVHHRIPKAQGGTDTYDNLELLHLYCHQQTHARRAP